MSNFCRLVVAQPAASLLPNLQFRYKTLRCRLFLCRRSAFISMRDSLHPSCISLFAPRWNGIYQVGARGIPLLSAPIALPLIKD